MTELKDWLNSINFTKENLVEEDPDVIKKYAPYIINRCLSGNLDCIMFVNEMTVTAEPIVEWTQNSMVEVMLNEPDDFLKVRETLTRIGVASRKEKKLYQSCHILHKQGRYFIVHFKELFALDGKHANLTVNDVQRRNRITRLLADWGLISVVKPESVADIAPLNQIKVLAYKDKGDWILEQKYNIGKKGKSQETE